MTYSFRILSNEKEKFLLEMEMGSSLDFYEFHSAIQTALDYDKAQMASFYLTNKSWEKEFEINLIDIPDDPGILNMKKCSLEDYIKGTGDRLLYVFDFFEERALNIEVVKLNENKENSAAPRVIALKGEAPQQSRMPDGLPDLLNEGLSDDEDILLESPDGLDI